MKMQYQNGDNRFDRTMCVEGDVSFKGTTIVDGTVKGNITGDTLIVTEPGEITGDLKMEKVVCSGKITGTITAKSVSVTETGRIKGRLACATLEIEQGAQVNCDVISENQPPEKKQAEIAGETTVYKTVQITKNETEEVKSLPSKEPASSEKKRSGHVVTGDERQEIVRSIIESLEGQKGMIKVVGGLKSGKTTICDTICLELADRFEVVRLDNVVGSVKDIFMQIAKSFKVEVDGRSSQKVIFEKLQQNLQQRQLKRRSVLIVMDDIQNMYPATLEGVLKILGPGNVTDGELFQIVMLGDEYLDKNLDPQSTGFFQKNGNCTFVLPSQPGS